MALGTKERACWLSVKNGRIRQWVRGAVKGEGHEVEHEFVSGVIQRLEKRWVEAQGAYRAHYELVITIVDGEETYKLAGHLPANWSLMFLARIADVPRDQKVEISVWPARDSELKIANCTIKKLLGGSNTAPCVADTTCPKKSEEELAKRTAGLTMKDLEDAKAAYAADLDKRRLVWADQVLTSDSRFVSGKPQDEDYSPIMDEEPHQGSANAHETGRDYVTLANLVSYEGFGVSLTFDRNPECWSAIMGPKSATAIQSLTKVLFQYEEAGLPETPLYQIIRAVLREGMVMESDIMKITGNQEVPAKAAAVVGKVLQNVPARLAPVIKRKIIAESLTIGGESDPFADGSQ